jgi:hypothetical protein
MKQRLVEDIQLLQFAAYIPCCSMLLGGTPCVQQLLDRQSCDARILALCTKMCGCGTCNLYIRTSLHCMHCLLVMLAACLRKLFKKE